MRYLIELDKTKIVSFWHDKGVIWHKIVPHMCNNIVKCQYNWLVKILPSTWLSWESYLIAKIFSMFFKHIILHNYQEWSIYLLWSKRKNVFDIDKIIKTKLCWNEFWKHPNLWCPEGIQIRLGFSGLSSHFIYTFNIYSVYISSYYLLCEYILNKILGKKHI